MSEAKRTMPELLITEESSIRRKHLSLVTQRLDLHNMYPDDRYGGLRKVKPGSTCCKDRDQIIEQLQESIDKLKEENKIYQEMFEAI